MLTIEEMLTLRRDEKSMPYMTGGEAALLLDEVLRLRKAAEESFVRGAEAMQAAVATCLRASYDAGAAGIVMSVDAKALENKVV